MCVPAAIIIIAIAITVLHYKTTRKIEITSSKQKNPYQQMRKLCVLLINHPHFTRHLRVCTIIIIISVHGTTHVLGTQYETELPNISKFFTNQSWITKGAKNTPSNQMNGTTEKKIIIMLEAASKKNL